MRFSYIDILEELTSIYLTHPNQNLSVILGGGAIVKFKVTNNCKIILKE